MGQLWNKTKNIELAETVDVATNLWQRSKGLLGRPTMPLKNALWIHSCNSIHTWFMQFAIDVIFVDRELRVKAAYSNVKPWRLVWPVWRASSVFELRSGQINSHNVQVGDLLDVRS